MRCRCRRAGGALQDHLRSRPGRPRERLSASECQPHPVEAFREDAGIFEALSGGGEHGRGADGISVPHCAHPTQAVAIEGILRRHHAALTSAFSAVQAIPTPPFPARRAGPILRRWRNFLTIPIRRQDRSKSLRATPPSIRRRIPPSPPAPRRRDQSNRRQIRRSPTCSEPPPDNSFERRADFAAAHRARKSTPRGWGEAPQAPYRGTAPLGELDPDLAKALGLDDDASTLAQAASDEREPAARAARGGFR